MAEGFDSAYHVRQQSRREKLRVQDFTTTTTTTTTTTNNFYDPSSLIFSSELLTSAAFKTSNSANNNVQEERMDVMGYISSNSSPSANSHNFYIDPPSLQDFNNDNNNNNPYLIMSPSNLRVSDRSLNFNNNGGLGVFSNAQGCLSLSLSSQLQQRYDRHHAVPLGPFTGYASILKGSRFLKPAQKMLQEICDVGANNYVEKITGDSGLLDPLPSSSLESLQRNEGDNGDPRNSKKSKLLWMLDEVYRRYKQYYQQMQEVVASFESVAGLSNIAPFANLALRAMSKHFRFLKDAITDQLQYTNKSYGQRNCANDETPRAGDPDACLYGHKPIQSIGFNDHQPVWRPQRGLPERAVTVLRAWLFDHFLHPYPTDTDKLMLAKQTGLSRNQVSNWFINARVRVWKPMVEEIHTLETTEGQKPSQKEQQNVNKSKDHLFASQNPSTSTQEVKDLPNKRSRDDYSNHVMGWEAPTNIPYGNPSSHPQTEIGMNGALGSVTLTLGLHQNDGMGITTEPFAINAARRLGLEVGNEGFVMGHFEAQNRQFSRQYVGGQVQLLHDFVG